MAFRFGDPGGRMYVVAGSGGANILAHWTLSNKIADWTVQAGQGRASGSCLRWTYSGANGINLGKALPQQQTWGVALAIRVGNLLPYPVFFFHDSIGAAPQMNVGITVAGTLVVQRNGVTLGTTTRAITPGSWHHVELRTKIDPSVGTYDLWLDGVLALSAAGVNTRASANSWADYLYLGSWLNSTAPTPLDYDDIIVYDSVATDANGFADITGPIGDCALTWLLPTGAGTTTQWTPDTGSNYARVNEVTPDGDTSYVASSTIGQIDTYALADLPGAATQVKSVAQVHYARKDDVGSRAFSGELRSAGANAAHATQQSLGNTYQYYWSGWGQNPNAGSPVNWTVAAVNALEVGQQVTT